jgi:hypothetical protein
MSHSDIEEVEVVEKPKRKNKSLKTSEYKEKVKELLFRIVPGTSLYEIHFEEGGEVPKALKSRYTSSAEAKKAIEMYKANRKQYHK